MEPEYVLPCSHKSPPLTPNLSHMKQFTPSHPVSLSSILQLGGWAEGSQFLTAKKKKENMLRNVTLGHVLSTHKDVFVTLCI
jgi:hypothetical protein